MSTRLRYFRIAIQIVLCLSAILADAILAFAGEPQWVEVRSPNFSVVTDAGEKRGREVAMRFEQMRAVFGSLMTKVNVNLPVPLQIVAFRNTKELRQVAPLFSGRPIQVAGLFQQGVDRSFIMLDMSVENPWQVVFHEYAHQLLNGNLKMDLDPWFQEGFAEYFSSIEVDGKEAAVGKVPNDEYVILRQSGMMKVSDLFRVQQNSSTYNENGDHRNSFYAESSILVHYLYDNRLIPKVGMYFDLVQLQHLPQEDAIQKAFGMSSQQFDKALRDYVMSGHYRYFKLAAPPGLSENTFSTTPITLTSAAAVIADIHLHSRDYGEQAAAEFERIVQADPNNPAACRGLGYVYLQKQDFSQAAEYFRRASQLDPKDPRVHYYNALLMARQSGFGPGVDTATMTKELESSIALDPTFADSYALLAFAQSSEGDSGKAVAAMQKALSISPRNKDYLFNLANLYLASRQPAQAITILQSLHVTDNPELAARVSALMAQAQQFAAVIQQGQSPPTTMAVVRPGDGGSAVRQPTSPTPSPTHAGVAKFFQGMLIAADCSNPPSALLTVVANGKTWKMKVADHDHMVLIGADEFSCSWSRKKVAINYRESAEGDPSVISLELQ
ncbi:MAG TPA: tetratricopeptide repeat protein [Candidatus Sulfotelmatobacter sp.]|jgi:cytochrome c-type biogenesis protein CcmH/NrfG